MPTEISTRWLSLVFDARPAIAISAVAMQGEGSEVRNFRRCAGTGCEGSAASHPIASLLFGLAPADPMTITAAIVAMMLLSSVASYLPARRASRVDPIVALRYE
ncbi:MAG: hypothetical protein M3P13_07660 [Acidobacteriota bacterium]|nr:hypothetical protein [Acidobacteriota bacterium]